MYIGPTLLNTVAVLIYFSAARLSGVKTKHVNDQLLSPVPHQRLWTQVVQLAHRCACCVAKKMRVANETDADRLKAEQVDNMFYNQQTVSVCMSREQFLISLRTIEELRHVLGTWIRSFKRSRVWIRIET